MHLILAVIQPTKLIVVREALEHHGITHLTVLDAEGYARQRGQTASYRGVEYQVDLLRKVAIEIVVEDDSVEPVLAILRQSALSGSEGQIGDGKIFVLPVVEAISIADGRRGERLAEKHTREGI